MTMKKETVWIIVGVYGSYVGWQQKRKTMIEQHCNDLGMTWKEAFAKGDRCIKATLSYKMPDIKS